MGIRELRAQASQLGIKNYSKLNKAELEAAVNAAANAVQTETVPADSKKIGEVEGRLILVSQQDTAESIGLLLGAFDKSGARKIRKMLFKSGFSKFSAVRRIELRQAKAA